MSRFTITPGHLHSSTPSSSLKYIHRLHTYTTTLKTKTCIAVPLTVLTCPHTVLQHPSYYTTVKYQAYTEHLFVRTQQTFCCIDQQLLNRMVSSRLKRPIFVTAFGDCSNSLSLSHVSNAVMSHNSNTQLPLRSDMQTNLFLISGG